MEPKQMMRGANPTVELDPAPRPQQGCPSSTRKLPLSASESKTPRGERALTDGVSGDHSLIELEAETCSRRNRHHAVLGGRTVEPHLLPDRIALGVGEALDIGAVGNGRDQLERDLRFLMMRHGKARGRAERGG